MKMPLSFFAGRTIYSILEKYQDFHRDLFCYCCLYCTVDRGSEINDFTTFSIRMQKKIIPHTTIKKINDSLSFQHSTEF